MKDVYCGLEQIVDGGLKNGIQDSGFRIQDCKKLTFPKSKIQNPKSKIQIAIISGGGEILSLLKERIKNSVLIKLPPKPDINEIIKALKREGIKRVVFAGKFEKSLIYKTKYFLQSNISCFTRNIKKYNDESIIKEVSERFSKEGIKMLNQKRWLLEFIATKGELTSIKLKISEWEDIKQGIIIAKRLNRFGIGQTICIKRGIVISLEALEGTNETIKRAGKITNNFVVVKYGKRGMEVPMVGEKTIKVMKEAGARVLAVRSNIVLILPKTIGFAEESNIALVGVQSNCGLEQIADCGLKNGIRDCKKLTFPKSEIKNE